jgi:hypothetical protein
MTLGGLQSWRGAYKQTTKLDARISPLVQNGPACPSGVVSFSELYQDAPRMPRDRAPEAQEPRSSQKRVLVRPANFEGLLQGRSEGAPLLGRLEGFEERSSKTRPVFETAVHRVADEVVSGFCLRSSNHSRRDTRQPTRGIRPSWADCQEQAGRPGNVGSSPSQSSKPVPPCHSRV